MLRLALFCCHRPHPHLFSTLTVGCPMRDPNPYCGTMFLKKYCTMSTVMAMGKYCPNLCGLCAREYLVVML